MCCILRGTYNDAFSPFGRVHVLLRTLYQPKTAESLPLRGLGAGLEEAFCTLT